MFQSSQSLQAKFGELIKGIGREVEPFALQFPKLSRDKQARVVHSLLLHQEKYEDLEPSMVFTYVPEEDLQTFQPQKIKEN